MARARLFAGVDQIDMAARVGKSRNTISAYERGVSEPPMSVLAEWAVVTGRSIDWLVWGDEGRPELVNAKAAPSEDEAASLVRPEGLEPPTF
ncbi:helix-turn-helix domain-containing protein [Agromyces sp. S2-1-8]|uniref:helix-turn-helix domain-containing protein n=1 Tax=Agromyces sp. S2-1-8 TaxID=2897180 RepID=UPI0035AB7A67